MKIIEEKEKLKKRKEEAKMERDEARRKKALLKSMTSTGMCRIYRQKCYEQPDIHYNEYRILILAVSFVLW